MRVVLKTNMPKSERIGLALARGFNANYFTENEIFNNWGIIDTIICYGFLRGGKKVIDRAIADGKDFYYADHGYFGRTKGYTDLYNSYFRITKNAYQPTDYIKGMKRERINKFVFSLKDWNDGSTCLITNPSDNMKAYFRESDAWTRNVFSSLREEGQTVKIRKKTEKEPVNWHQTKRLYTYNSTLFVESLLNGVVVVSSDECVCRDISGTTDFDRVDFFSWLSWNQFTLEEIENGTAKKILQETYTEQNRSDGVSKVS